MEQQTFTRGKEHKYVKLEDVTDCDVQAVGISLVVDSANRNNHLLCPIKRM